jgi:dihydrofolate synthase / folylpolyglutamate synthase
MPTNKDTNNQYERCLKILYGLGRFGIILGLDTIRSILANLDNPQDHFACIHIAGTNGKGSIASALASILRACGYKTGLYTSPHLVRFNERFNIDGKPIADFELVAAYEAVAAAVKARKDQREATFFEYATAMALYEFSQQKVDWAIIETGMGGRLDATNIVAPEVTVISNISLEHKFYLGDTIAQIVGEKAGIIKKDTPVVTGVRQKAAIEVVAKQARQKKAPYFRLGEHFKVRRGQTGPFNYFGFDHVWRNMETPLKGNFQVDNAALVLASCEALIRKGLSLPEAKIRSGLTQNRWPGRLEVASTEPLIILDGAHNLMAARNLARFIGHSLKAEKLTLVVGILDDKPYAAMLKDLLKHCDRVIVTRADNERALAPEILKAEAKKHVAQTFIVATVAKAVKRAIETAAPDEAICIAGSLYVVGEAKTALERPDISALLAGCK